MILLECCLTEQSQHFLVAAVIQKEICDYGYVGSQCDSTTLLVCTHAFVFAIRRVDVEENLHGPRFPDDPLMILNFDRCEALYKSVDLSSCRQSVSTEKLSSE